MNLGAGQPAGPGGGECCALSEGRADLDAHVVEAARTALDYLGGKWVVPVVAALSRRPLRRGDLSRALEPYVEGERLHDKVLTETLRRMEAAGFVDRTATSDMPPVVVYQLTPDGRSLIAPILHLAAWTDTRRLPCRSA